VVSPTAPTHVTAAAAAHGATAKAAESQKTRKYGPLCHNASVEFWPVGFETFGTPGPEAERLLRLLGERLAARWNLARPHAISRLRQKVSVGLLRGVATMLLNRLPHCSPLGHPQGSFGSTDPLAPLWP